MRPSANPTAMIAKIENIKKVTIEEVTEMGARVELDTIYLNHGVCIIKKR